MKKLMILFLGVILTNNAWSQDLLVESNNDFAFKIYNATKSDSSNFFISPFSLNIALAIANEGASSSTRQEMDSLLSIRKIDNRALHYDELVHKTTDLNDSDFKLCIKLLGGKQGNNELYLANSLWVNNDDDFEIDPDFVKNIKKNYKSDIFKIKNQKVPAANKKLNDWVSKKTNGKISEIKGFDDSIMLSIVNAIYFMGEWEVPFDENKTKDKKFHTIDRKKIDVKFMRDQNHFRYYEDADIQAIYLPYKCNQFSMVVILPQKRYGILEIEENLNSSYFRKIKGSSYSHEVILSFPKFKIESEISPKQEIINMGYPVMFSDTADFSGISRKLPLKISEITHKTFLEVDEKKTEAAAVTKIDMVVTGYGGGKKPPPPPPKVFNANHPFIFLIVDNRTNAILFTGRFVKE